MTPMDSAYNDISDLLCRLAECVSVRNSWALSNASENAPRKEVMKVWFITGAPPMASPC